MSDKTPKADSPFDPKDVQSFLALLVGTILFVLFFLVLIPTAARWGLEPHTADQPSVLSPGWLDIAEAPAERGRAIPPVDPAEVMDPTAAMVGRGKALFADNCVTCHGEKGAGDGPAAPTTNPKPRNFTAASGWKNGPTRTGIYKTLSEGIPGSSMASFDTLPPRDRMALVHYVRSLGSFDPGKDDAKALLALSDQFRSSGGRVPNRIPVSEAERMLREEAPVPPPLALDPASQDPGGVLARRVVLDPGLASRTLAALPNWRTNAALFALAAASGAPGNGFSSGTGALTPAEWKTLHDYLARTTSAKGGSK
jgi:mono/diheme cytochrome c family protein